MSIDSRYLGIDEAAMPLYTKESLTRNHTKWYYRVYTGHIYIYKIKYTYIFYII